MNSIPYIAGVFAILAFYVASYLITGKTNPLALAIGVDKNFSASLLQFLIFTYLTIFAYVSIYFARLPYGLITLPNIPLNLLLLMGISVVSATASKGIVVSRVEQGELPTATEAKVTGTDKGNAVRDKEGNVALTKVQMLIWTLIAATVYLITVVNFINAKEYTRTTIALPDVDGALLVLMGAAQGGYIGGKLVNGSNTAIPAIELILPSPASLAILRDTQVGNKSLAIIGSLFTETTDGKPTDGNIVIYENQESKARGEIKVDRWLDDRIEFTVPTEMVVGTYMIWVRCNGQVSNRQVIEVRV